MIAVSVGLVVPTGSVSAVKDVAIAVRLAELLVTPFKLAVIVKIHTRTGG